MALFVREKKKRTQERLENRDPPLNFCNRSRTETGNVYLVYIPVLEYLFAKCYSFIPGTCYVVFLEKCARWCGGVVLHQAWATSVIVTIIIDAQFGVVGLKKMSGIHMPISTTLSSRELSVCICSVFIRNWSG